MYRSCQLLYTGISQAAYPTIFTMESRKQPLVIAMVMVFCLMTTSGQRCYSTELNPYRYFAAKTRYDDSIKEAEPTSNVQGGYSNQPRLFYLLIRHGSRFPSATDYNNMVKYLSELQGRIKNSSDSGNSSLCPEDLSNLLSWKQRIRQEDVDDLAQFGVREMKEIARKYQNLFPDLLKAPYDKDKFLFQSSYMERNILSAKAFANGLFGNEEVEVSHNPKGQDSLLQFYKNCHKASQTRKNPMPERTKFIQGHINQVTIPAIETFLGFAKGSLTFDYIDAMYKMCVFDHVVYDDSPWCAVFSRQNLVTMEYMEDLRNYYLEGPAYQINTDQSCDLLKDVAKYLRMPSKESPGNYPAGVFRFTHSPVINSFLAQLGVFDGQDALRSSNMAEQDQRKWRLSLKDPYSAHVALVVNERTDSKFELLTFINERLSSSHDWDTVMSTVGETADSCDFNAVCENNGVNISRVNYLVIFAIILGCVI